MSGPLISFTSVALMRAGRRPVGRLEDLPGPQLEEARQQIRTLLGESVTVEAVPACSGSGEGAVDLFYGFDARLIDEALELTRREKQGDAGAELRGVTERIGVVFGYPECCARAFANLPFFEKKRNEWAHLRLRCERPGAVDPELNPFTGLTPGHLPCSLDCPATRQLVEIVRDAGLRQRGHPDPVPSIDCRPVVFLLDRPGLFVPLELEAQGDDLRYRAPVIARRDSRLAILDRGDTLRPGPGTLTVERAGERLHTFILDAAVWWHERAFDPEFWALLALNGREPDAPGVRTPDDDPRLTAFTRRTAAIVRQAGRIITARTGWSIEDIRPDRDRVTVSLTDGRRRLQAVVEPAAPGRAAYRSGDRYAVSHPADDPPRSDSGHRSLLLLLSILEAAHRVRRGQAGDESE